MKDKVDSFWSIAKAEIKELKAKLNHKDRDAEEIESRHRVEIKVCRSHSIFQCYK